VAKGLNALQLASCCGNFSIARRLIDAGADVNPLGKESMMLPAIYMVRN